ncbi:hypothetical protein [Komagataeibacter phage phiKX1]|nr:hypothetical protein [Komagataeibacter phage phiKX1]BCZ76101.1 hypothetical protein [Komagataeibacter phage phiKX2]
MGRHIDITGQQFGHMVALKYVGSSVWRCQCERCGREGQRLSIDLRNGTATQCRRCDLLDQRTARKQQARRKSRAAHSSSVRRALREKRKAQSVAISHPRRPWTVSDEQVLLGLWDALQPIGHIADALKRSPQAVRVKILAYAKAGKLKSASAVTEERCRMGLKVLAKHKGAHGGTVPMSAIQKAYGTCQPPIDQILVEDLPDDLLPFREIREVDFDIGRIVEREYGGTFDLRGMPY